MRYTDARKEKPEIIVYLGDSADCGAGVVGGALLINGDSRGEALNVLHIGLLQAAEELAGIGRERFDIAALALSKNGMEGQRRLAGTRQAGDDNELVARDIDG